LEAARAEIGYVGRDIRHPAEVPAGSDDAVIIELLAKVIHVQRAGKKAGDRLGCGVKGHVDLAIGGDLATRRFERQRVSRLVPEEPLVLFGTLHRQVGDLGLCLRCGCRSLRGAGFGGSRLCLRFARLPFGGLRVGVTLLLLGLQVLYLGLERIDLRFQRAEFIRRDALRVGNPSGPEQ
jgi:hypothetical protein